MSTRSVIAARTKRGFKGVYHHWDGYPSGLGAELFRLYRSRFKKDLTAMMQELIKKHPAGWSSIFNEECYCHKNGNSSEKALAVTEKNASGSGCEYAYILEEGPDGDQMVILSSYCNPKSKYAGQKMIGAFGCGDDKGIWKPIATVLLNGKEPKWENIKA